jgi:hypothetical protein
MSQEQLKGFLEAVQADVSLQEKLQAISSTSGEDQSVTDDEYDDAIFAIAKETGFIISAEDLQKLRTELELIENNENNENNDGDLTDEQLEAVAGGVAFGTAASVLFGAGLLTLGVGGRTGWFSRRFGSR